MKDHTFHHDPLARYITQRFSVVWMRCLLATGVHCLLVNAVSWTCGPEVALYPGMLGIWLLVATAVWFHLTCWLTVVRKCKSVPHRITWLLILRQFIATELVQFTAVIAGTLMLMALPASVVVPKWSMIVHKQVVLYLVLLLARAFSTAVFVGIARDRAAQTKREAYNVSYSQQFVWTHDDMRQMQEQR